MEKVIRRGTEEMEKVIRRGRTEEMEKVIRRGRTRDGEGYKQGKNKRWRRL